MELHPMRLASALMAVAIVASVPPGRITAVLPLLQQAAVAAGCEAHRAPADTELPPMTSRTTTTTIVQRPDENAEIIVSCEP